MLNKDLDLLVEWKALATAAERGKFVEALKGCLSINKGDFKAVYRFPLNTDKMGKMAINFRKSNAVTKGEAAWHEGNVCVFEYVDDAGKLKYHVQETILGNGKHSERLAIEFLESQNIPLKNVKRIYSEYEPCHLESGGKKGEGCKKMIENEIGTEISISYSYDYPGIGADAAKKIIREQSKAQKVFDFNKFK